MCMIYGTGYEWISKRNLGAGLASKENPPGIFFWIGRRRSWKANLNFGDETMSTLFIDVKQWRKSEKRKTRKLHKIFIVLLQLSFHFGKV